MMKSVQIRGDSELLKISNLFDACPNLKRLEYQGVNTFDQLSKYDYSKLAHLKRVVVSTYFFSSDSLDQFLTRLPNLSYLELSQVSLSEPLMQKCCEKFRTMAVSNHPDIPHAKRQSLQQKF